MQIQVLLFAAYRQQAGVRELQLEVPEGSSLRAVAETVEARFEGLSLEGGLCARNEQYASPDAQVQEGDRVAFFPPVSGGSDDRDCLIVTEEALDPQEYAAWVSEPAYGAVAGFLGTVRSPNAGQRVRYIDYQGYEAMIRAQMSVVAGELRERFDLGRVVIAHRLGRLVPGDASIAIAISSRHRKDALQAVQTCIDRCKELLPVWKYEVNEGGSSWVEGHAVQGAVLDRDRVEPGGSGGG